MRAVKGEFLSSAQAMRLAVAEARKGFSHVSPNPLVGCVVLDSEGRFLSAGHHERFGEAHAEVNAVKGLSARELQGAQVFVTLEPCAHEGKTPSCAKMLATLPIDRVVYGLEDPNPLVMGRGAGVLKTAGIPCLHYREISPHDLQDELEELCEAFLWNFRHRSVFVALKVGCTLDSQIALSSGESKWITGEESRREVHRLRASYDAILVGSGTVLADDPRLDIRHPDIRKANTAVVIDPSGKLRSKQDQLALGKRESGKTLWIEGERDPGKILERLWDEGLRSVMIEGGSRIASAFFTAGLINRLHLFRAPVLFGNQGRSFAEFFQVKSMGERLNLRNVKNLNFGPDSYLTGLLRDPHTGLVYRGM
ncbi:MAG TPA: bifunctional diaminohydroxyphosphoribosylaminopyrimidine deaminase/5-amino-6-(5-phosphoribosylamino)uracil reductase RibD [Pseudobdellovibrionaceae bacterium]|nr:bifunctional diaminohydroxyphosphoribosylaminopyrimidine deaminase/5-amino-6-(5-phosphoribosylamino)uracil reductase RibD [Pseudobdellovibrionaceae bacterium]